MTMSTTRDPDVNPGPPRLGAAYAQHSWQLWDEARSGGQAQGGTYPLRLPQEHRLKQRALAHQIKHVGFPFMRPLQGHISCINALAFSKDGRWLASGGDDMRILIRDMFEDINSERSDAFVALPGHRANIFTLSWSCDGRHLFSGGNDGRVFQYDVNTLSNLAKRPRVELIPGQTQRDFLATLPSLSHSALLSAPVTMTGLEFLLDTPAIREVSAHPANPALLLACTQHGILTLNDIRVPAPSIVGRVRLSARRGLFALSGRSFAGVQWRPRASDGNTFAACVSTSSNKLDVTNVKTAAGTRLFDARMCFGSTSSRFGGWGAAPGMSIGTGVEADDFDASTILGDHNAIMVYDSILERFERRSEDEVRAYVTATDGLNVRFDSTGEYLATDVTGFKPIIYQIDQSEPIAVCDGPGYSTRCTTKHGSFGRFGTAWDQMARCDEEIEAEAYPFQDVFDELGAAAREAAAASRTEREGFYYITGSDDFRGRGWAIPPADLLVSAREEVEELAILRGEAPIDGLYFVSNSGAPTWVPRLRKPTFTLEGAQSITNTTLAHPHLPLIATSGIERLVRLYSPLPFSEHDELPHDGSLSVPLLRPGLTRQRGKKPAQPEGADDERDAIFIAETLLCHQAEDDADTRRRNQRLLHTRQLCREGDVKDASTLVQFDEFLIEEENERRDKLRHIKRASTPPLQGSVKRASNANAALSGGEAEGKELFHSKPDFVYRLRRLFDGIRRTSDEASTPSTLSPKVGSQAMATTMSGGSDRGGTLLAASRNFNPSSPPVPRATRPWRRTTTRGIQAGGTEATRSAASAAQAELDARSDPGPVGGSSSSSSDTSVSGNDEDDESDDIMDGPSSEDDDGPQQEDGEQRGGAPGAQSGNASTQDWLLRASRRLGLQQLSSRTPPKLAGGVWDVRQYSPSTSPPHRSNRDQQQVEREGERGSLSPRTVISRTLGLDPDEDDEVEEDDDDVSETDETDDDASQADSGPFPTGGRGRHRQERHDLPSTSNGAEVEPGTDRGEEEEEDEEGRNGGRSFVDGMTEYERWVRTELGRDREEGEEDEMELDASDDEEEGEEDDGDEEETDGDGGEDEDDEGTDIPGGRTPLPRRGGSRALQDDDDDDAVAYRRLGRDRP